VGSNRPAVKASASRYLCLTGPSEPRKRPTLFGRYPSLPCRRGAATRAPNGASEGRLNWAASSLPPRATGSSQATASTSAGSPTSATSGTLTTPTRSLSAAAASSGRADGPSPLKRWRKSGQARGRSCYESLTPRSSVRRQPEGGGSPRFQLCWTGRDRTLRKPRDPRRVRRRPGAQSLLTERVDSPAAAHASRYRLVPRGVAPSVRMGASAPRAKQQPGCSIRARMETSSTKRASGVTDLLVLSDQRFARRVGARYPLSGLGLALASAWRTRS
jgi:hypothetical protein